MSDRLTDADLAELEALHEAAAVPPWDRLWVVTGRNGGSRPQSLGREIGANETLMREAPGYRDVSEWEAEVGNPIPFTLADCAFIAAARSALPALVAEVRRLRAALARIAECRQVSDCGMSVKALSGREDAELAKEVLGE